MAITRPRLAIVVLAAFAAGMLAIAAIFQAGGILAIWNGQRTGVFLLDAAAADPGYVLIAPLHTTEPRLIAHDGRVVHAWHLTHPVSTMAQMLPDGSLVYIADAPTGGGGKGPPGVDGNLGVVKVSWDSKQTWEYDDPDVHHDFTVLPDGTVATLRTHPLSDALSASIVGGAPGSEFNGHMWGDQIIEASPETSGARVVFDDETDLELSSHPLPAFLNRSEWTHANSIEYTPSDPITGQKAYLVNSRSLSTIFLISRATGDVIWEYGGLWVMNQEHDASLLANGHVLVFDNGQYVRGFPSSSMVLEIDPKTGSIVWSFPERRDAFSRLYSSIMGGAQRLPNGDTLITYAVPGRVLEVTPDGNIVWDFRLSSGSIFKARSYSAAEVESLL